MKEEELADDDLMKGDPVAETEVQPVQAKKGKAAGEPAKARSRQGKAGLRSILGGGVLASEQVLKHLPLLFLIVFFAIVLITSRYWSQRTIRQIEVVQDSIKELKAEAVTYETELMKMNRPSEIAARVKENGLELLEPQLPARKLKVKKTDEQQKLNQGGDKK